MKRVILPTKERGFYDRMNIVYCNATFKNSHSPPLICMMLKGVVPGIFRRVADSSNEGL